MLNGRQALSRGLAAVALLAATGRAGEPAWPQWRGPGRNGVAIGTKLPDALPATLKRLWEVEVGAGHSSPAVADGRVVVIARQGEDEVVQCLDARDGKALWRDSYAAPFTPQAVAKAHGKGPFATPTIADAMVYTLGVSGVLSCYDLAAGKLAWRHDFKEQFKKTHPTWGAANSPLIEGGLCILGVGAKKEGGLAAFDARTGKPVWQQATDGAAYSSPVAVELAGQRQAVVLLEHKLVGVEFKAGKLLWETPFVVQYEQNIITPLTLKDMVVIAGWGQGAAAWRIGADGAKEAWRNAAHSMFMSSPVVRGGHLFGLSDRGGGTLVCLGLDDGKALWTSPGKMGPYASLVLADDRLLVLTTKGELLLVAADPAEFRELGRAKLTDRPVWGHLAVAGKRLYVKDSSHAACFELPE